MPKVELKQAVKDCFKVSLDSCSCQNFNVNCDGPNLRNLFEKVAGDNIRTLIWSRKYNLYSMALDYGLIFVKIRNFKFIISTPDKM